jgi:hypothetical protein
MPTQSLWKQAFDAVDRRVSPTIDAIARSEEAAVVVGLVERTRREATHRMEQSSRRVLHLLNLPAGSDVNRLLTHIARLEREIGELRAQLADREAAEYLAELAAARAPRTEPARNAKGGSRHGRPHAGSAARPASA